MVDQTEQLDEHGAQHEHIDWFKLYPVPRSNFDRALLALLALRPHPGLDGTRDGRRALMRRALDNQASWDSIRHWRRGTRPAPQWAVDLLNKKLTERLKELDRALAA